MTPFSLFKKTLLIILLPGFLFVSRSHAHGNGGQLDSLLRVWKQNTTVSDSNNLHLLSDIAWEYMHQSAYDSASRFLTMLEERSEHIHYLKGKATAVFYRGMIAEYKGNTTEALKQYLVAQKMYEQMGFKTGIGSGYNSMGNVFQEQGNYAEAIRYFRLALAIRQEMNDKKREATCYNNIGNAYVMMMDYKNALENHQKALEIRLKLGDPQGIAMSNVNIGTLYMNMGKYSEALGYFESSLKVCKEIPDDYGIATNLQSLGALYDELKQYPKSILMQHEAILYGKKVGNNELIRNSYRALAKVYGETGKYKEAFDYHQLYSDLKDSMLNQENNKTLDELKTVYETEKKDKQLILKDAQIEREQADGHRKTLQRNGFIAGSGLLAVLAFYIFRGYRQKKMAGEIIGRQKAEVERQKTIVEEKNKEITDSITYARRIQGAILPPGKYVQDLLPDSFIFYRPKDIVSGDIYWVEQSHGKILFASIDCTGHGVPGAIVSMVAHNNLNRCVKEFGLLEPALILDKLNELVEETFSRSEEHVNDGMDISLCLLDRNSGLLEYAGANNPLWIIRNGIIGEVKADKQPIGKFSNRKKFTNHRIQMETGNTVFLFTDGFADQFGGPEGKKFKYKKLMGELVNLQLKSMPDQGIELSGIFSSWKGNLEQVDDVLIMGVRV